MLLSQSLLSKALQMQAYLNLAKHSVARSLGFEGLEEGLVLLWAPLQVSFLVQLLVRWLGSLLTR